MTSLITITLAALKSPGSSNDSCFIRLVFCQRQVICAQRFPSPIRRKMRTMRLTGWKLGLGLGLGVGNGIRA